MHNMEPQIYTKEGWDLKMCVYTMVNIQKWSQYVPYKKDYMTFENMYIFFATRYNKHTFRSKKKKITLTKMY